jgi:hypothetical protein
VKEDAVGGTPTAAVETTALPMKSLMIGAPQQPGAIIIDTAGLSGRISSVSHRRLNL